MPKRGRSARGRQEDAASAQTDALVDWYDALGSGRGSGAAAAAAAGGAPDGSDSDAFSSEEEPSSKYSSSSDEEDQVKPARKKKKQAAAARGSKKKAAAGARKKPAKVAVSRQRIGAKKAMKLYCLTEADLAAMKDTKFTYSPLCGGHTMYAPQELEEYARAKHAGNASFDFEATLAEHLRDEQDRRSRRRGYRAEETAAALQAVAEYAVPNKAIEVEQYGETKLPDSCLIKVMECLARTREPGGLRGFACVARDLANASLANWDLYRAAKAGFALLGQEAKALPGPDPFRLSTPYHTSWSVRFRYGGHLRNLPGGPDLGGWGFWEGFLREPLKPTVAQLRKAFELVDMTAKGSKATMALRLLEVFGLKAATSVPAQLLWVVRLERFRTIRHLDWDGPDAAGVHARVSTAIDQMIHAGKEGWGHLGRAHQDGSRPGMATIRATIRQHYTSIDEFLQAAQAADEERQRKQQEAFAAAAASDPPLSVVAATAKAAAATGGLLKPMSSFAASLLLAEHWELEDRYFLDDYDEDGF